MSPDKALPVESLLPFPQQPRVQDTVSSLRTALNEAKEDEEDDSQPDDEVSDSGKPSKRPKRARACIACRNMKIRCLPVDGQDACLSCSKVNRECIMPGPARKRQKTVHKVAELEKKINALTDALIAKNQTNPTPPSESPASQRLDSQSDVTRTSNNTVQSDTQRMENVFERYGLPRRPFLQSGVVNSNLPGAGIGKLDMQFCTGDTTAAPEPYADVIERGILDMDTAAAMFNHYESTLKPFFPILAFPSYVTASDVRAARPMVFLAILAITSAAIRPVLQQDLVTELSRRLSERVLFMGEKSLELVQAMLIYTAYYVRSRYAKDLAFNQYIHSAVVMCLDLGMGKRYPIKVNRNKIEEAEVRRTWMACYYFALNVSILLRHPSLVRWSSYLEESVEMMSRPDAIPGDRWLASLCSLAHIAEEVSIVFDMDDPSASISFTETKTQYHLKAFEKQLTQWKASLPNTVDKRLAEHHYGSINLYIHEIAIHHDHDVQDFGMASLQKDQSQPTGSFVTTVHIDALTACLDSSQRVLNAYLKLDLTTCRSVPNLYIVWNTYAEVALIKLHGVLHAPDSTFGSIFTPDLRVEYYLDAITAKLQEISGGGRYSQADAFIFVTKKLRIWHTHKRAPAYEGIDAATSGRDPVRTDYELAEKGVNTLMKRFQGGRPQFFDPSWGPGGGLGSSQNQDQNQSEDQRQTQTQHEPQNPGDVPSAVTTGTGNASIEMEIFGASQTSDLNAAYNAANYNIDWNDVSFSQDEMDLFDSYMNDQGWMGYLM